MPCLLFVRVCYRTSNHEQAKKTSSRQAEVHSAQMKGTATKLSKQIQDQWAQLRSNAPSARAERERAVLAFSNSSQMAKYSTPGSLNNLLSLNKGVAAQANNKSIQPKSIYMSSKDVVNQDQVDAVINHGGQNKASMYSSGTHPVLTNGRIRQVQLSHHTEEGRNTEIITVSKARTRLWRKPSTNFGNAQLQEIWKHQADKDLKTCTQEKEAQEQLSRVQGDKCQEIRTDEKMATLGKRSMHDGLRIGVERMAKPQKELDNPFQLHPHDTPSSLSTPASILPTTTMQEQFTMNPTKLVKRNSIMNHDSG